jgi:hypothetical protein
MLVNNLHKLAGVDGGVKLTCTSCPPWHIKVGMTDSTEPKDQRVPVMMTSSELKAVDDWSFEQRIRSRGEAIRRLIALGLKAVGKKEK